MRTPVVLMLVSLTAACNFGRKIDHTKTEGLITESFGEKGVTLASVSCPKGIKAKKDDTFDCEAKLKNGDSLRIEYTQTDNKGTVKITHSDNVVVMSQIAVGIDAMFKRKGAKDIKPTSCPENKKAEKGNRFECRAEGPTGAFIIGVDENDDKGNVSYGIIGVERQAADLAKELTGNLVEKGAKEASVDCGKDPIRLIDKKVVTCKATTKKTGERPLEVLPDGNLGAFRWRVAE